MYPASIDEDYSQIDEEDNNSDTVRQKAHPQ